MNTLAPARPTIPAPPSSPESFIGRINTFGLGPIYEVGPPIRQMQDGDWLMKITLIESGEVTEYPLSSIKEDPEAA